MVNESRDISNKNESFKYSICYIVPYFGKLDETFKVWLYTCKYNPSIDWILFIDDREKYDFPSNVHVIYSNFEEIRKRIRDFYDFEISLDTPYKLCDYRVAYGEIFQEELKRYDFWGYCDLDIIWGNIRNILNDDVLEKYDKIGFQGHSTLYRNNSEINRKYRSEIKGRLLYKEAFSNPKQYNFDEYGINTIFVELNIPFYQEVTFSTLAYYQKNFRLRYINANKKKNKHLIFRWDNGMLLQVYERNGEPFSDETMYVHYQKRRPNVEISCIENRFIYVPDKITKDRKIDIKFLRENTKYHWLDFIINRIIMCDKKFSIKKAIKNIFCFFYYNKTAFLENDKKKCIVNLDNYRR